MADRNDPNEIAVAPPGRGTSIALGIALLIIGALAIIFPFVATVAVSLLIGALLVVLGVLQFFDAFRRRSAGDTLLEVIIGVISLIAGIIILFDVETGIFSLTVVLGAFFAADGVLRLFFAFRRPETQARRGWLIFGGILSLVLAALILFGLPQTVGFAVGLLFGVHVLFLGISLLILGGRQAPGETELV